MAEKMTREQAYLAMFEFLRAYYERGPSEEVAMILGSMQLSPDGSPMDLA